MSCCEKQMIERLKNIEHASVLASQDAHARNMRIAVVKLNHNLYGEYYYGIDYEEAKQKGYKVLREYSPGKSMKKNVKARGKYKSS